MVHALVAELRRLDGDAQAGDRLLLADVLGERARPELALELRLLGRRDAGEHPALVGRGRGAHAFPAPR